jgi:DNA polymerase III alpha subunit
MLSRVKSKDLNKKSLEALIKSGTLDRFGERQKLLKNLDRMLQFVKEVNTVSDNGQSSLFANLPQAQLASLRLSDCPPAEKLERLNWEKEFLGLFISEHPLAEYSAYLKQIITPTDELHEKNNAFVRVAGVISAVKRIFTRKGDLMLFVKIEDTAGSTELLIFPKVLTAAPSEIWQENKVILVEGRVSDKDGEMKVIVERVGALDLNNLAADVQNFIKAGNAYGFAGLAVNNPPPIKKPAAPARPVFSGANLPVAISLSEPLQPEKISRLKELLAAHAGQQPVFLMIKQLDGSLKKIKTSLTVAWSDQLKQQVDKLLQ